MRHPSFMVVAIGAFAAVAVACSLLTDFDGLANSGGPATGGDGGDAELGGEGGGVTDANGSDGAATDGSVAHEAYLFAAGGVGVDGGVEVPLRTTLFARIASDGSLGPWTAGPDLPVERHRHGVIGVGDTVHVVGGYTPTVLGVGDITSTHLDADGGFVPFVGLPPLPHTTNDSCPTVVANRTYLVTPGTNEVQFATMVSGGFSGWEVQSGLDGSAGSYYGQAVAIGPQIFWFGLDTKALASTVGADGRLGDWRLLAPMPLLFSTTAGVAAAYGSFLYLLGGFTMSGGGLPSPDVYVATVGADGTVGAWRATEPYPQARDSCSALAYDGYLYILGGELVGNDVSNVSYAKIRADGTIDPWKPTTPLPTAHRGACVYGAVAR